MELADFKVETAKIIAEYRDWFISEIDRFGGSFTDLDNAYIEGLNTAINLLFQVESNEES
jgi:hypothetical protein